MKKLLVSIALSAILASTNANAFWGSNNGPYGDYNDWPVWTPMYWMEEMANEFDDEWGDGGYYPYAGGYGAPGPYYGAPNAYGAPNGYGAPAPYYGSPYGGAPGYAPYPAPQAAQ